MKFLNQQPLESFENTRSIYIDTANNTLGVAGKIALFKNNDITSFRTDIQASNSLTTNLTLTLPSTTGTAGQVLTTDGAGNLSYATVTGTGTVTSISGTGTVSGLSLSGTVTTSGDLTLSGTLEVVPSNFDVQTANKVLVGPASGSAATPTFRTLVAADIPALNYQAPISATGLLKSNGTSGNVSAAVSGTDYALPNQTMYLGTTAIALNRASATGLSLVGVSVDGSAGSVAAANLTGNTLASGVTGSSLTSVGTLNGVTVGGDIAITGTARRITGDFSNSTIANRIAFQTSTTDSSTILTAYPNGAGTTTGLNLYNGTDPLNSNIAQFSIIATETRIAATAVGTATNIPMTFYTGGSESVRIGSTAGTDKGTVGIGYNSLTNVGVNGLAVAGKVGAGTNAPTNILEVQETGTGTGNGGLTVSTISTGGNAGIRFKTASTENWQITTTGASGSVALRFYDIVNSAERMRIDASGNIGIGTTSTALNALNVVAKASINYAMFDAPTAGYAYTSLKYAGSFYGYFGQGSAVITGGSNTDFGIRSENSLVFGISTVEKMRLHSNGYVGIGNASPTGLLTLGSASGTNGNIVLNGSTSGAVTIQTAVAAGTWTLTLPTSAGTSGYVLQTDGSGVTSWISVALPGGTTYVGTTAVALNRTSANQALTGITSVAFPGSTSGTATLQATATAGTPTLSLPTATGTLVGTGDSGTVTNTMLANSSFYIGTTSVSLGRASASLALTGITSIDGSAGKATNLVGGNNTTLLGSIPYQSNTDTTTLLGPNTTTTKKFLRMTGNGTSGTPPAWDTISASDVPTLNQNTSGSAGSVANTLTIGSGLSGTSYNGSAAVTIAVDSTVALRADTHYIGTTSVALNRTSANLALTGITSITGGSSVSQSLTLQSTSGVGTSDSILFKVGNNGATTAMTVDTSGNVGIGTTTFTGKLNVQGSGVTSLIQSGSASAVASFNIGRTDIEYTLATVGSANQFFTGTTAGDSIIGYGTQKFWIGTGDYNSAGSASMVFDSSGNVGIGQTSPGYKLDVGGGTGLQVIRINGASSGTSAGSAVYMAQGGSTNIAIGNYSAIIGGAYDATAYVYSSGAFAIKTGGGIGTNMVIDTSGNVGIGTSSPSTYGKFGVVSGSTYFGVATDTYTSAIIGPRPANDGVVSFALDYAAVGVSSSFWKIDASASIFSIYQNANARLNIDSSGNVGIGTSSPASLLNISTTSNNGNPTFRISGGTGTGANVGQIDFYSNAGTAVVSSIKTTRDGSDSGGAVAFYTAASGTNSERMRIDSSGNVGIGTTAPVNPLQVVGAIRAGAGPTDATNASITMYNDGTGASIEAFQGNNATVKRNLWLNAYGGNVGVGTASPGVLFDVNGTSRSSYNIIYGTANYVGQTITNLYSSAQGVSYIDAHNRNDVSDSHIFFTHNVDGSSNILFGTQTAGTFADRRATAATIDGSGNFTATGNVTAYSDIKLKTNIETIDNALDKVSRMRGVMFTRKDTGAKGTGVIAQEIKEVLPEVVQDGETLSVAYGNIVGVLIEAIKELKAEIEQLKGNK